jgi:hypothetical protein
MIETFVSRPNWAPPVIEHKLLPFYSTLQEFGFNPNTIGKNQTPLRSPFEDVLRLMGRCKCTIVLGLPQIFVESGTVKHASVQERFTLPTEWNQIEATMSLMHNLPTLVLLHKTVSARGIFEKGAANIFVHGFDCLESNWLDGVKPALRALRAEVSSA